MALFQTENLWLNQLADGVAALVLDVPERKVNVLNRKVLTEFEAALDKVASGDFNVLLVKSGKPDSFCAGADVQALAAGITSEEAAALSEFGQCVFNKLAALPVPSVAVVSGHCLGGGLELALACDYRVAVERPTTTLGLPEVELGLLPAWGGTQRLPRLIGLERAMLVMAGARRLRPLEALDWGLVDEIAADDEPPALLAHPQKQQRRGLPGRTWRQWFLEKNRLGRWLLFRGIRRWMKRRVPDDMPAPWEALAAVETGVCEGIEQGLARERQALGRLVSTTACRNLVHLFLTRDEARKPPEKKRPEARTLRRIGLIGAGAMGTAIAHLAVLRGFEVVIREADEMTLGLALVRQLGMFKTALEKGGIIQDDVKRKLANIHGTTAWKGFENAGLVIEAVDEDLMKKQALFAEIEKHVPSEAMIVSITSSLRIEELQQGLRKPERVAGLHFFPAVAKVPLIEVVRAKSTDAGTIEDLLDWARKLGRTGVVVTDSPGFLVHRMLMPAWNEAALLLIEGVAETRIDEAMTRFGMPMGPLEYLDQMGLDEAAALARALQPIFGERLPLSPLFELMAQKGWLGLKTGLGFFRYKGGRQKKHYALQGELAQLDRPGNREAFSASDQNRHIQERLVAMIVNEAGRCLDENLADENTIDLAMVLAGAWPPHRGGPLRYLASQGYKPAAALLTELAARHGPRFSPCPKLLELARR